MARNGKVLAPATLPALYATVQPGLEPLAADEVNRELGAKVKKVERGLVVFKLDAITPKLLQLRTTEDVFLLCWGSDGLSYKADDLAKFRKWTATKPDWPNLFKIHHALRPRTSGKPTFHLVCQREGSTASAAWTRSTPSPTGCPAKSPKAGSRATRMRGWKSGSRSRGRPRSAACA